MIDCDGKLHYREEISQKRLVKISSYSLKYEIG